MTPAEYLQKLFEHFRDVLTKTNSSMAKLFQGTSEEGVQVSGILDNKLIAELNRRLIQDPNYQLPDGYQKFVEKEIENKYTIPEYFPISESQRVAIEVFDGLLWSMLNIHILEPMAVVREHVRARPVMKLMAKDKIMNELTNATGKNALPVGRPRVSRAEKTSQSIDVNPIIAKKMSLPGAMARDNSKAEINKKLLQSKPLPEPLAHPRPQLNVTMKLEVAN